MLRSVTVPKHSEYSQPQSALSIYFIKPMVCVVEAAAQSKVFKVLLPFACYWYCVFVVVSSSDGMSLPTHPLYSCCCHSHSISSLSSYIAQSLYMLTWVLRLHLSFNCLFPFIFVKILLCVNTCYYFFNH